MNLEIELVSGKRYMHIVLTDGEILAFDHLLNRALNTMSPNAAHPWLALEAQIEAFIKNG